MISDQRAQQIASDWHGGGGSALYQFSSTGAIVPGLITEIDRNMDTTAEQPREFLRLSWLKHYVSTIGERGPVDDWYSRVICAS